MSDSLATLQQTSSPIDLRREDVQPMQEQLRARQVSGIHREHKLRCHDGKPGDAHAPVSEHKQQRVPGRTNIAIETACIIPIDARGSCRLAHSAAPNSGT
jgi:hypothetical protein